jgi:hypothetical protein
LRLFQKKHHNSLFKGTEMPESRMEMILEDGETDGGDSMDLGDSASVLMGSLLQDPEATRRALSMLGSSSGPLQDLMNFDGDDKDETRSERGDAVVKNLERLAGSLEQQAMLESIFAASAKSALQPVAKTPPGSSASSVVSEIRPDTAPAAGSVTSGVRGSSSSSLQAVPTPEPATDGPQVFDISDDSVSVSTVTSYVVVPNFGEGQLDV